VNVSFQSKMSVCGWLSSEWQLF